MPEKGLKFAKALSDLARRSPPTHHRLGQRFLTRTRRHSRVTRRLWPALASIKVFVVALATLVVLAQGTVAGEGPAAGTGELRTEGSAAVRRGRVPRGIAAPRRSDILAVLYCE